MSGPSRSKYNHHQLRTPSRSPAHVQQASFVPTSSSGTASPESLLSPTDSADEFGPDTLALARRVPKGQTLMTSYMVSGKVGTRSSARKRTQSHTRPVPTLPSLTVQTHSDGSATLDPFLVADNTALGSLSKSPLITGSSTAYYQPGAEAAPQGASLEGLGVEAGVAVGSQRVAYQIYGGQEANSYGSDAEGIYARTESVTPLSLHPPLPVYARPGTAESTKSQLVQTPSTVIGTPASTPQHLQPLLTTSRLPLATSHQYGYPAETSSAGQPPTTFPYQHLGYAAPSYGYHYPQYVTPEGYGPIYAIDPNMAYTMGHPVYATPSGPSYGYHLLPPPPPSQTQVPQYRSHGEYPQSAPAKSASGNNSSFGHQVYPQGYAPGGSYETPVRPKRGSGVARKGKAVAAPAVGDDEDGHSRRSSVESTPPPISRSMGTRSEASDTATSEVGASTSSQAEGSTKKRSSPVKQGSKDSGEQYAKRSRGLEIKRSSAEGRRLVFPETPSPEAVHAELHAPQTPPRQIRHDPRMSPRKTAAPGLMQTPNGTTSLGVNEILESDLGWLEPILKPLESPYYSTSKRAEAVTNLTKSERRRRRVDAFRIADEVDVDLKTTVLKGYGRLAVRKSTALSFLGVDESNAEPEEESSAVLLTPIAKHQSLPHTLTSGPITPKSTPQSTRTQADEAPITVPDWPDASYPWIGMVESRKKETDKMAEVAKLEKLSRIERYLSHVSDDELEESDESEEQVDLSYPADKTLEPSNAKDAMFNLTRNGLPAFSAGNNGPYLSGAMPTVSGEDESGCLCGGLQHGAGNMVCCDNCSTWFHLNCCGIASEDDLGESWLCWRCEPNQVTAVQSTPTISDQMGTPQMAQGSIPAYASVDDSARTQRMYTSDAALAPSPVFSSSGRHPQRYSDVEDTPEPLYSSRTPRIPSSGSTFRFMTPGTPAMPARMRNVSYAEHYNVCQTPGASRGSDYKIYSTPKFEDLLNEYTPHRATSPTPGGRARVLSRSNPMFTTPSTSQNFFQGLQTGSSSATPGLVYSSSASGQYSPYPSSPRSAPPKLHPALSELAASPSPFRSHRRQVSFNRVTFATTSSNLRDSVVLEDIRLLGKGRPLGLGGDLADMSKK